MTRAVCDWCRKKKARDAGEWHDTDWVCQDCIDRMWQHVDKELKAKIVAIYSGL